ncbi:Predicted metal-dependent peptidase [Prevotella sp. ne3005]|uniref:vWA domain-containing protein n=1 Tax=Prevotella sp. ne3005 TaxID=1761887 RepID=UPI0008C20195|nr:VWA-like domain-containing protein [Prevotella sp. ne3005]SEN24068.1 Predicted metal-dependent peptidase [Prevotella sp. ne3005]
MTARERIQQEAEQWFLTEPVLFAVYCSHRLTMNANMLCPLRTGKGRIEYNPTVIDALQDNQLKDLLKVEMIRILLQHPYARQPLGCLPVMLQTASDMVISPAYKFSWIDLAKPEDFGLPQGQYYEWYANRLNDMVQGQQSQSQGEEQSQDQNQSGGQGQKQETDSTEKSAESATSGTDGADSGENDKMGGKSKGTDYTSLWEEDQFQARLITDLVQSSTQWGSLPGDMVELIKKAAEGKIDYRGALRTFRSSILSQKRRLTRMRPSRRFGFEQMGSHYDFTTRLLIAIDTSGSVDSDILGRYFRIITTFFKYGIQEIDVLMFDHEVQGMPIKLDEAKKNKQEFKVKGRGGTDFQAPVDYVKENPNYDGLIIITDGYAPTPEVPPFLRTKLLWVIDNEQSYKLRYESLRKTGRVCLMEL